ncbi:ead/Ea22-like family protein [Citrobacter portucalensis]|uniref:Ead/Ea22-like family protein n=1 Tax=Citrobacter portucalensis TaxID=1639133 RepID=A0ABD5H4T3_9ENTR|nr:ead/Ea22-like family protein [Citrobacter portucalensis]MDW2636322.1 ead/Ea22-like family protein [Citrobacter portucalensis]
MTALNKQALRSKSRAASAGKWIKESGDGWEAICSSDDQANGNFIIAHFEGPDAEANREFVQVANPDTVLALLDELEAAEKRIAEQSEIVAAAEKLVRCKGRYHSELNYRALAKLFGVTMPDLPPLEHENVHYADAAEMEIAALRQRINELEARTVTVKLPELCVGVVQDGHAVMVPYAAGHWFNKTAILEMLAAAGIGVKGD